MKRKKRVLCEDFPEGSIPRAELEKGFRELREKRLARERRARAAAPNSDPSKAPRRQGGASRAELSAGDQAA